MFTGIITDVGRVLEMSPALKISTAFDVTTIDIGASIACSGVCLTVVDKGDDWFSAEVSEETLACTTLGGWQASSGVNLERALRVGEELGGHIVTGHVDGVSKILSITPDADSFRLTFSFPDGLARFIAAKGSVTINGVSLTVNEVDEDFFGVNIIPHTTEKTTFADLKAGDRVNIEIDILARYVSRMNNF